MYSSANYSTDARGYRSQLMSRALSPRFHNNRPGPRLADCTFSPLQSTDTSNVSDFINQIQAQLKRINSSFAFKFSSEPPLVQAVGFLTQAVDTFLAHHESKGSNGLEEESELNLSQKLKEDLERSRETSKNLKRYELLLKKKEEKLEEEKSKLRSERRSLKEMEDQLKSAVSSFESQERSWNENKKYENEKIRFEKEETERKLSEAKELKEKIDKKIEETTKHLKFEKDSLMQLEQCLNQTKQTLSADQKRISQEKLEIEKEKWRQEQKQRKLEEAEILLNVKQEHLEQERVNLENEKINFQALRKSIEDEKHELYSIKDQIVAYERDSKMSGRQAEEIYTEEKYGSPDYDSKFMELEEREREIEQAYKELQEQMDNFNKELEEREIILDEREIAVDKQEKDIKKKLENFQIIESSLIESKIQVEELRTFTIPELEKQSNVLENLLQELNDKKNELEILVDNLQHELSILSRHRNGLEIIEEDRSMEISNELVHNDIAEMAIELEQKLLRVREREEELEIELAHLEKEKNEVIRAAEIVKKAHEDVEEKRKRYDKEVLEEKEKLKSQILKIENGTKLLGAKEAEIFAFKKKLEEKSLMLSMKEKEINARLTKSDSQSSSIVEERA